MLAYLARRLLFIGPLLVGVTMLAFATVRLGDVNPAVLIAGPQAPPETVAAIARELHLDRPVAVQYLYYVQDVLRGDFGTSWVTSRPVLDEVRDRLPITLELVVLGTLGALVIGVVVGMLGAFRENTVIDGVVRLGTLAGISMPIFWMALLAIFVFAFSLGWAPPPLGRMDIALLPPDKAVGTYLVDGVLAGEPTTVRSALAHLVLPVLTISVVEGAVIAKHVRAVTTEVLGSEMYRYARSFGYSPARLHRLVLRNTFPSILAFTAIVFSATLGASALVEMVFSWGGLGSLGIEAIKQADFAVVQAYILVTAAITAVVYLAADVTAAWLDPRLRHEVGE